MEKEFMTQLTPEIMRAWESRLTKKQMDYAILLAAQNGWVNGHNPPMWVWAQIFRQAELEYPTPPQAANDATKNN